MQVIKINCMCFDLYVFNLSILFHDFIVAEHQGNRHYCHSNPTNLIALTGMIHNLNLHFDINFGFKIVKLILC